MKATCKGKEFEIYEVNEADSVGIKAIENWRNAEIGDWIRTHDNMVVRVTGKRVNKLKGKRKPITFIRTGFGETPTYYKKSMPKNKNAGQEMTSFISNMFATSQQLYSKTVR